VKTAVEKISCVSKGKLAVPYIYANKIKEEFLNEYPAINEMSEQFVLN
jgi:hypothetical protein